MYLENSKVKHFQDLNDLQTHHLGLTMISFFKISSDIDLLECNIYKPIQDMRMYL